MPRSSRTPVRSISASAITGGPTSPTCCWPSRSREFRCPRQRLGRRSRHRKGLVRYDLVTDPGVIPGCNAQMGLYRLGFTGLRRGGFETRPTKVRLAHTSFDMRASDMHQRRMVLVAMAGLLLVAASPVQAADAPSPNDTARF